MHLHLRGRPSSCSYAEADPTLDVGGFDARSKLRILMKLAVRAALGLSHSVPRARPHPAAGCGGCCARTHAWARPRRRLARRPRASPTASHTHAAHAHTH
eukprot:6278398-Prymnesium_polylepis.1